MSAQDARRLVVADLAKTDVVVVPARSIVAEAVALLSKGHVSGAPVVEGEHVVGVVTMGDLRRWSVATDSDELDPPARARWAGRGSLERVQVADLLGRRAITARPDWLLARALAVVEAAGVQRLPVVDDTGRLVGVVSREALLATVPGRRPPSDEPDARR
jgi:CBS domain-containing protein